MNFHNITLFDGKPIQFWETVIASNGGCIALFLICFNGNVLIIDF
jgi:magnesium transporter